MHRLMSADGDRFSYFLYWEMFFPSLLQKKVIRWLGRCDEKFLGGWFRRRLVVWDDKKFGAYRHMHNMSLWNAEEDCFAMQAAFVTQQWSLEIPMMHVLDLFHLDQMPQRRRRWLRHYRELVKRQLLLNGGENKIHLSKNPLMSGWVDALIDTFPDARFVVMMRNPAECIPSCLKLVEVTWKSKGWQREDYAVSLSVLSDISFDHFHNPRRALARHPETLHTVMDYRQLTAAPREAVQGVYQALGLKLTTQFDAWLQEQAEREKQHHSRFEYSLGDYANLGERLERELSDFYNDYDWPRSNSKSDTAEHGAAA
jgi:hypothetical protein